MNYVVSSSITDISGQNTIEMQIEVLLMEKNKLIREFEKVINNKKPYIESISFAGSIILSCSIALLTKSIDDFILPKESWETLIGAVIVVSALYSVYIHKKHKNWKKDNEGITAEVIVDRLISEAKKFTTNYVVDITTSSASIEHPSI